MKDYATFVMFGALCVFGCASTEEPSTTSGTNTAGTGTPIASAGTPGTAPSVAGQTATPLATAGKPATGGAGAMAMAPPSNPGTAAGSGGTPASSATAGMSAAAGSGGSATPGTDAPAKGSFLAAYTLALRDMCMGCHATGGLFTSPDFATPDKAYASLVDKDASTMAPGQCGGKGKLVTPGNCETSLLYNKVTQMTPTCGRRMPLSSDASPQLIPQAGLDALCDWIKAGAKKDP